MGGRDMKYRLRDGTGTVDLKYIVEDTDRHGNVRTYFRRHGRKVRILETPGTDEFMAAYRAALETGHSLQPVKSTAAMAKLRRILATRCEGSTAVCGGVWRVRRNKGNNGHERPLAIAQPMR